MKRLFLAHVETIAIMLFTLAGVGPSLGAEKLVISNQASDKIGLFPRPSVTDVDLIKAIAELGAGQKAVVPAGTDISRYIAQTCGQPSATVELHPVYEQILLASNPGLKRSDLHKLSRTVTLELPACGTFAEAAGPRPAPKGVEVLTSHLSVPFNSVAFDKVFADRSLRRSFQTKYGSAISTGDVDPFQEEVRDFCNNIVNISNPDLQLKYLSCSNAVEIAAANPQIKKPTTIKGDVVLPISANLSVQDQVYVPLKVALTPSIGGPARNLPKATQEPLRFVTELNTPEEIGDACANSERDSRGAWPFDIAEFRRVLSRADILENDIGKILIVDTGFDFADGSWSEKPAIQSVFAQRYFHRLPKEKDPERQNDQNDDGVFGNGGWVGVNLANTIGTPSAATSIAYEHRAHGLSVTTLALGGADREMEELRRISKLPLAIGEASIVQLNTTNPILSNRHVESSTKFAKASGNEFNIINLSLSSTEHITEFDNLVSDQATRLILVVAAGNDHSLLTAKDGVWPAVLGGPSSAATAASTVFITVGAHDGHGDRPDFSNYGLSVDILAPGCAVPSYDLAIDNVSDRNIIGITPKMVSGTSVAAPLVSFVAALLVGAPKVAKSPIRVKTRIQAGSNYDYSLRNETFSSGTLNVAKTIAFKYDVLEVIDEDKLREEKARLHGDDAQAIDPKSRKYRKLKLGTLTTAAETIECNGVTVPFASIKKIARSKDEGGLLLVLSNEDQGKPFLLNRHFCPPSAFEGLEYEFYDIDVDKSEKIRALDVWDYVARL